MMFLAETLSQVEVNDFFFFIKAAHLEALDTGYWRVNLGQSDCLRVNLLSTLNDCRLGLGFTSTSGSIYIKINA